MTNYGIFKEGSSSFFVFDLEYDKKSGKSTFRNWLKEEGFESVILSNLLKDPQRLWINVNNFTTAAMTVGIGYATPCGKCMITSDEFKIIYNIIKSKENHNL